MKPYSQRQEEAEERQALRAKRSIPEQIALLDKRFGVGLGAKKERAKLAAKLEANKNKKG